MQLQSLAHLYDASTQAVLQIVPITGRSLAQMIDHSSEATFT